MIDYIAHNLRLLEPESPRSVVSPAASIGPAPLNLGQETPEEADEADREELFDDNAPFDLSEF